MLLKVIRPTFSGVTANWQDLYDNLKSHIPRLTYTGILWQLPPTGWIKYNIDGVCRGSDGTTSYAFFIEDGVGDLLYAQADEIQDATNNIAEATPILEELGYIVHSQLPPCVIEMDSLLMKRILDEIWNLHGILLYKWKRSKSSCLVVLLKYLMCLGKEIS